MIPCVTATVSTALPAELVVRLDREAERLGVSRSRLVRDAIEHVLRGCSLPPELLDNLATVCDALGVPPSAYLTSAARLKFALEPVEGRDFVELD